MRSSILNCWKLQKARRNRQNNRKKPQRSGMQSRYAVRQNDLPECQALGRKRRNSERRVSPSESEGFCGSGESIPNPSIASWYSSPPKDVTAVTHVRALREMMRMTHSLSAFSSISMASIKTRAGGASGTIIDRASSMEADSCTSNPSRRNGSMALYIFRALRLTSRIAVYGNFICVLSFCKPGIAEAKRRAWIIVQCPPRQVFSCENSCSLLAMKAFTPSPTVGTRPA